MTRAELAGRVGARLAELGARRVAVAVSGGLDSTALLRLAVEAGCDVRAVHADHGLRAESGRDAAFVVGLAAALGVPCRVVAAPPVAGNVQAEARAARYAALEAAAAELGCDAVATAHTADDQAETLLLALVRGAGLRGLAGMPPSRPIRRGSAVALARPLLDTERAELAAVASAEGWSWREDASNERETYRRNWLRHNVLKALKTEGGHGTARRIAAAAAAARDALDDVGPARRVRELGTTDARGGWLPLDALAELTAPARRAVWAEALAAWTDAPRSAATVDAVDALLGAQPGRRVDLGDWTAWRDRDRVRLAAGVSAPPPASAGGAPPWALATSTGVLHAAPADPSGQARRDGDTVAVAARALARGAELRPWRAGDRMRPMGLGGSRAVADVLADRHVPPSDKAHQLVLVADGEVVWLVGHRLGEPARLTPGEPAVRLVWEPAAEARRP